MIAAMEESKTVHIRAFFTIFPTQNPKFHTIPKNGWVCYVEFTFLPDLLFSPSPGRILFQRDN